MQLERIAVRLRPRNAWEALDLGLALVRANARGVYAIWFALYLPAAIAVHLAFLASPFYGWIVLWWLKPLFDRAVLAVLARSMFGESPSARAVIRNPREWLLGTGLLAALTWRRFDFARSFHLPVHQLERPTGKPGRERVRVLDRDARGAAVWLTFLLVNLEALFTLAISLGVVLMLPVQLPLEGLLEDWFRWQFEDGEAGGLLGALIAALAVSLVEPLYVAAGFTLYLQRRTMLEGWDIELRFRTLSDRLAASAREAAAVICAAALALTLVLAPARDALAQSEAPVAAPAPDAKAEIRKVLAAPEFGRDEKSRSLRYIGPEWKSDSKPSTTDWSWIAKLSLFLGEAARFLAWGLGAIAIGIALYFIARYVRLHRGAGGARERPDFLFGLDVRPESLPEDVAGAAAALAAQGRSREALSLLYRGALVRFLDQGMEFQRGDTEGDCLRRVDLLAARPLRDYFRRLVSAWQALAYGHHAVARDAIEALASDWRAQFGMQAP